MNSTEENIGLACSHIHSKLSEYVIKTTYKSIQDMIQRIENEKNEVKMRLVFRKLYTNLTKYSEYDLDQHYQKQTKEWQDWCNDVLIFYCNRYVLFNGSMKIPVVQLPS